LNAPVRNTPLPSFCAKRRDSSPGRELRRPRWIASRSLCSSSALARQGTNCVGQSRLNQLRKRAILGLERGHPGLLTRTKLCESVNGDGQVLRCRVKPRDRMATKPGHRILKLTLDRADRGLVGDYGYLFRASSLGAAAPVGIYGDKPVRRGSGPRSQHTSKSALHSILARFARRSWQAGGSECTPDG
jgi:hypothetical protein